jgi:predicted HicB family RNase H-like nuclease
MFDICQPLLETRMTKECRLGIRIDADLKAKAEALARADRRSLSSWVVALIAREIESAKPAAKAKK